MMSSICWLVKSISIGRSLQVTSLTDHEHEPFWRSSTAISGSLLTFDAAKVVSPSWCFAMLTCRTFLGKELALSVPQTSPLSSLSWKVHVLNLYCSLRGFVPDSALCFLLSSHMVAPRIQACDCHVKRLWTFLASLPCTNEQALKETIFNCYNYLVKLRAGLASVWVPSHWFCMSPSDESLHNEETWPSELFIAEYNFSLFPFITLLLLSSQKISFPWAKELRSMMNVSFSWMGQGNREEVNSGLSILQFISSGIINGFWRLSSITILITIIIIIIITFIYTRSKQSG